MWLFWRSKKSLKTIYSFIHANIIMNIRIRIRIKIEAMIKMTKPHLLRIHSKLGTERTTLGVSMEARHPSQDVSKSRKRRAIVISTRQYARFPYQRNQTPVPCTKVSPVRRKMPFTFQARASRIRISLRS